MILWYSLISWVIGTVALYYAARFMSVEVSLAQAAITWFAASACELIPWVGLPLAVVVLFLALKSLTQEKVWPVLAQLLALTVAITVVIALLIGAVIGTITGALS